MRRGHDKGVVARTGHRPAQQTGWQPPTCSPPTAADLIKRFMAMTDFTYPINTASKSAQRLFDIVRLLSSAPTCLVLVLVHWCSPRTILCPAPPEAEDTECIETPCSSPTRECGPAMGGNGMRVIPCDDANAGTLCRGYCKPGTSISRRPCEPSRWLRRRIPMRPWCTLGRRTRWVRAPTGEMCPKVPLPWACTYHALV